MNIFTQKDRRGELVIVTLVVLIAFLLGIIGSDLARSLAWNDHGGHMTHMHGEYDDHHDKMAGMGYAANEKHYDSWRENMSTMHDKMAHELLESEDYQCCIDGHCQLCLTKTPGHGVGPTCQCLDDIYNGVHPCAECIGLILEGHGNPLIAEYYATAIAEKIGEKHTEMLQQIIEDVYGILKENQI